MQYKKVYVEVTVKFDTDGNMIPLKIIWKDGTEYYIDRILNAKRAASTKAGGTGIKYAIRVSGKTTFLWYEDPGWFVEAKAV